jgi:hypothetical protein
VIEITRHGDGGADPRLDRPDDLHDPFAARDQRLDAVTDANLARRLRAAAVDPDVPGLAQLGCQGTRFHEAHGTQLAINPSLICRRAISHTVHWNTKPILGKPGAEAA